MNQLNSFCSNKNYVNISITVIPVWREPLPGWTDNINGPTGLLIAAGKGVLRSMYCNENGYADFLPADIAANALGLVIGDFYRTNGYDFLFN